MLRPIAKDFAPLLPIAAGQNLSVVLLTVILLIGCGKDAVVRTVFKEGELEDFVTVSVESLDFQPTEREQSLLLANHNNFSAPWTVRRERDWLVVSPGEGAIQPWGVHQIVVAIDPQKMTQWKEFATLTIDVPIYEEKHEVVVSAVNPSLHPAKQVLDALQTAFHQENSDQYVSHFWADGFLYESSMGIYRNPNPQQIRERDAYAEQIDIIFRVYDNLELNFEPIYSMSGGVDSRQVEVGVRYEAKGLHTSTKISVTGRGEATFIFERRGADWRIREWRLQPELRHTALLWM